MYDPICLCPQWLPEDALLGPDHSGGCAASALGILPRTPPLKLFAGTFLVAFAAAALYAARFSVPLLLFIISTNPDLRLNQTSKSWKTPHRHNPNQYQHLRINSHNHPQHTMRPLCTINKHRFRIVNRHIKRLHRRGVNPTSRHKPGMDPSSARIALLNRFTWRRETRLCDSMVDLRELELYDITWLGGDFVGSED